LNWDKKQRAFVACSLFSWPYMDTGPGSYPVLLAPHGESDCGLHFDYDYGRQYIAPTAMLLFFHNISGRWRLLLHILIFRAMEVALCRTDLEWQRARAMEGQGQDTTTLYY
jgi:hypothetical protein